MTERLTALYHVHADSTSIAAQAQAIAVEQSVEMPLDAISDPIETIGQVEDITDLGNDTFAVKIGLAVSTTGFEAGQLMNMLFGNSSIHDHIRLVDVNLPASLTQAFLGPRGMTAKSRALTCSALKPQGLPPQGLARIGAQLAAGGLDYIKDDHGLANQSYAPFADRIPACAKAIRDANPNTRYIPSVTGNLDQMRAQIRIAKDHGLTAFMIAPMVAGIPTLDVLRRENPEMEIFAHPALAGASRIAAPLLLGKLFRLFGADATIFPNYGGRFGYTEQTCHALAQSATGDWAHKQPTMPVPAGGMSTARVDEMLDFYGTHVMLLIGGALLAARDNMTRETLAFTQKVAQYGHPS